MLHRKGFYTVTKVTRSRPHMLSFCIRDKHCVPPLLPPHSSLLCFHLSHTLLTFLTHFSPPVHQLIDRWSLLSLDHFVLPSIYTSIYFQCNASAVYLELLLAWGTEAISKSICSRKEMTSPPPSNRKQGCTACASTVAHKYTQFLIYTQSLKTDPLLSNAAMVLL